MFQKLAFMKVVSETLYRTISYNFLPTLSVDHFKFPIQVEFVGDIRKLFSVQFPKRTLLLHPVPSKVYFELGQFWSNILWQCLNLTLPVLALCIELQGESLLWTHFVFHSSHISPQI